MPQTDVSTIVGSQQLKSLDDILNRDPMETLKEAYLIKHGTDMNVDQTALLADLLSGIKNESND
jgi:exonuclease SbcD